MEMICETLINSRTDSIGFGGSATGNSIVGGVGGARDWAAVDWSGRSGDRLQGGASQAQEDPRSGQPLSQLQEAAVD